MRLPILSTLLIVTAIALAAPLQGQDPAGATPAEQQHFAGLHNVFKVDARLYSGSSPHDDNAFAALAAAGVKMVISVDGSKPDVDRARQHGLRYVHLPIGYNGIAKQRVAELIKAASTVEGGVYVHCHHGKHRGPAATAAICQGIRGWNSETATTWMHQAGTSPDYAGLYRDILQFQKPDSATLDDIKQLPEIAATPPLVDAMVAIDDYFDLLNKSQAGQWRGVPGHPDLTPTHAATLLWENFRELHRDGADRHGPDYRREMRMAEESAAALATALKASKLLEADAALKKVSTDCTRCHKAHRN